MAPLRAFATLVGADQLRLAAGRLRTVGGVAAVLAAVLALVGGVVGWSLMQHRGPDGGFGAALAPLDTDGYAIVVPDPAALVAAQGRLATAGVSRLHVTVTSTDGPLLVGLAADRAALSYLSGVRHAVLSDVRMARGQLPVRLDLVAGARSVADPRAQPFWRSTSTGSADLTVGGSSPPAPALILMRADGSAGVHVTVRVSVFPRWLNPATWGLLILGPLLLVLGLVSLTWRRRPATVVVVPATDVAALVTVLRQATGALPTVPTARHRPNSVRAPAPPPPPAPLSVGPVSPAAPLPVGPSSPAAPVSGRPVVARPISGPPVPLGEAPMSGSARGEGWTSGEFMALGEGTSGEVVQPPEVVEPRAVFDLPALPDVRELPDLSVLAAPATPPEPAASPEPATPPEPAASPEPATPPEPAGSPEPAWSAGSADPPELAALARRLAGGRPGATAPRDRAAMLAAHARTLPGLRAARVPSITPLPPLTLDIRWRPRGVGGAERDGDTRASDPVPGELGQHVDEPARPSTYEGPPAGDAPRDDQAPADVETWPADGVAPDGGSLPAGGAVAPGH